MYSKDHVVKPAELSRLVGSPMRLQEVEPCHDRLFQGQLSWQRLRSGLSLHCSDCVELHNFSTQVTVSPHLNFVLFLKGHSDVSYDDRLFRLGVREDRQQGELPQGFTVGMFQPMEFSRQARRGSHIRKVSVSLSPEWFESGGFAGHEGLRQLIDFDKQHFSLHQWQPSPRLLALVEQCLHPADTNPLLRNLYLESRALELVAEGLRLLDQRPATPVKGLRPHEYQRIRRTLELLHSDAADGWSLEQIAREIGTNISTLQRQFQATQGMTLFEYQRHRKLLQAREALERKGVSVSQAAWIAGYGSAANFSTAFKRAFGLTPSQVRARF